MANDPRDINPRLASLITCQNATMAQFAAQLQPLAPDQFAYSVEDATGLTGGWDAQGPGLGRGGRQLGLKLEMRKQMLPVIVIDHMEEKPTDN